MKRLYQELMGIARAVLRQAEGVRAGGDEIARPRRNSRPRSTWSGG